MSFEEFADTVREQVGKELKLEVSIKVVNHNNGVKLTGITALDDEHVVSPVVYIDRMYDDYRNNEKDIQDVVREICEMFRDSRFPMDVDVSAFNSFQTARENIVFRLVNYEKNAEMLEKVPHRRFLDLAISYYFPLRKFPFRSMASIRITNSVMESWGVTEEELYRVAIENNPRMLPVTVRTMDSMIKDIAENMIESLLTGEGNAEEKEEKMRQLRDMLKGELPIPMYVMSNEDQIEGAASMLYSDSLKELAGKLKNDLYILPCSIHELIIIKAEEKKDVEELQAMVKYVNGEHVDREELLSDSVYLYKRESNSIEIAG